MGSFFSNFFGLRAGRHDGEAELKNLRKEVQKSIKQNCTEHKRFFPAGRIEQLITVGRIRDVLSPNLSEDLVTFVSQHATKIFLALVCGGECSVDELVSIMRSFQAHGMTDDKLPVQQMSCIGRGDNTRACFPQHDPCLNVFHDSRWEDIMFRFRDDQCIFDPPVFTDQQFRYDLTAECVLPFTSRGSSERDGHFSTVSEVILHQDHFVTVREEAETEGVRLRRVASREPLRVALKKMKHLSEPGYNVGSAWEHEVSALNEIRDLRHPHLIRPLAAIKHGLEHYIMFEWADGGSLRDVWKAEGDDAKPLTPDRVMCVLEELLGIAGALAALHNTNTRTRTGIATRTATRASSLMRAAASAQVGVRAPTRPQNLQVPRIRIQRDSSDDESHRDSDRSYISDDADTNPEVHWRHGDLKPDNILRFRDQTAQRWLGTLKIADLGLAKQHFLQTSRRNEQTQQRYTTSQYEAPEAMANLRSPRSRRYDIWSMGCIIFEFVIFMLYGLDGLNAFYGERDPTQLSTDTLYFTLDVDNDTADVSHIVKHWMSWILRDPECSRPEGGAISDLILLVRDRLLVVGLPEDHMSEDEIQQCRADASELQRRLEKIRRLALDGGDIYLLRQPTRLHSQAPPRSRAQLMEARTEGGRFLRAPGSQAPRRELPLDKTWNFLVDNDFASTFFHNRLYSSSLFPRTSRLAVCEDCGRLSTWTSTSSVIRLEHKSPGCRLHELVLRASAIKSPMTETTAEIRRDGSKLFLNGFPAPVLSLFRSPPSSFHLAKSPEGTENVLSEIQIGFPDLQQIPGQMYFDLLSHWLQDCDTNHPQCSRAGSWKPPRSPTTPLLPTRLIDVEHQSPRSEKDTIRLVETTAVSKHGLPNDNRYIALSHPWGIGSDNDHFCTTRQNITSRIEDGFAVCTLPATLLDAVTITRALKVRYLWIDTICIVQGPDGDFDTESRLMETVFSLAYCVIAASRASGTSSGFLSSRPSRDFMAINTSDSPNGTTLYVAATIDDFQSDVIDGPLNKRGWVLQERALARRTIYFTATQTYFECGDGVRCESLTKMTNNQASFLGDPSFPTVALKFSKGGKIRLYEMLYKTYSALQFTKMWDRPIAIAGLEQRLVRAFKTHGGYGVFDGPFFGRSLLWKRDEKAEGNEVMKAIEFPEGDRRYYHVPTWSWMAYQGVIDFLDVPFDGVEWQYTEEEGVFSPWGKATEREQVDVEVPTGDAVWHTGKANKRTVLRAVARKLDVSLEEADTKIVYDGGNKLGRGGASEVRVVVVGRQKTGNKQITNVGALQHYVLVVGRGEEDGTAYRRLGVAKIPGSWIDHEKAGKKISVV
ncbi:heterokaryon incompatibility protein-domain-containing protein [Podospora aff. communis PSN243]|uniref:Heterokaryon incompatibility protein-domain-containing protein n=1 Tax=Podospora aff. communis PSN243 TaxID=3040156 RepID=A0AAV9G4Q2_9PEZI|nr:heterokaryon incompatibility protein-domain-containing protein [Podospora aff. communis PSN243]